MTVLMYLAVFVGCTLAVCFLRERSLYVLFFFAYTQNFVVPFLYTHGYVGLEFARALIVVKDIVLLELFVWAAILLIDRFQPPWPRPLKPLLLLVAYCTVRFVVAALLGDDWRDGLFMLRNIWFPLEILTVVMVLAALRPDFGKRFLRQMVYTLSFLAIVALAILFFAPRNFWVENANIAVVQNDVKGEAPNAMDPYALDFKTGLGSSGMLGETRSEYLGFLFNFRAIGTFGEALALAFSMVVPVLVLLFYSKRTPLTIIALSLAAAALLFSLTRSAWIFCAVVSVYILLRRRRYRLLAIGGCLILAGLTVWSPLADFASSSISQLSGNPETGHAQGIMWFYTRGFSDLGNVLGKGMSPEAQTIPESGYAYLLEHFGLFAYIAFLWFCIALYRQLRERQRGGARLSLLAQAIPLGIIVIMHFSQYPFSLPDFLSLWYVVGLALSGYLVPVTIVARDRATIVVGSQRELHMPGAEGTNSFPAPA